ncbi:hypothetical protein GCM10027174_45130 [Salinifilum aidingensis]
MQHAADEHAALVRSNRNAALYRLISDLPLSCRRHPAAWLARQLDQSSAAPAPVE